MSLRQVMPERDFPLMPGTGLRSLKKRLRKLTQL